MTGKRGRRVGTDGSTPRRHRAVIAIAACGVLAASCASPSAAKPPLSSSTSTTDRAAPSTSSRHSTTTTRVSTPAHTTARTSPAPRATWTLVTEPADGLQPIYSLMSSARHELNMTMYELSDTRAVEILEADAARGVTVRVILDSAYSGSSVNAAAYSELSSHGVQVHWAPSSTIFHQKTITVDDATSAIMTLNLTSQYYASSRDFAVITTDRPDVDAIDEVFSSDWSSSGAPGPGPTGTNLVWSPGAESPILSLIGSAQHSLLIENEEMDDPYVVDALEAACRRGVDVEVVMTYSSSWSSEFAELVDAGVKVRTYASDAPLYIHAKVIVADDTTAFVGSQNFSEASLEYNRELGIITSDAALVGPIARTVTADFTGASPFGTGGGTGTSSPPGTTQGGSAAECQATASPANDGYSGDYDVYVHSNQPDEKATASDSGDTYSEETDSSGYAEITLWHTSPGETITVTVGAATCTTEA